MRFFFIILIFWVFVARVASTSNDVRINIQLRYIEPRPLHLEDWETEMISEQEREDAENDHHTPSVDDKDSQPVPIENTPIGRLELGEVIHRGHASAIFASANRPDMLIKYQANCDEISTGNLVIHPLIYDYWMMREASTINIAPEPIFLSPAALLVDIYGSDVNRKLLFEMRTSQWLNCLARDGTVRYMILRRVENGVSLHNFRSHWFRSIMPMTFAAHVIIRVLHALEKMHKMLKIIHGDIHSGNIMIRRNNSTDVNDFSVVLIDFGRARIDPGNLTNDRIHPIGKWFHNLCSPWQIDGRHCGRRDDIYKTVHMYGCLINPFEYCAREELFLQAHGPESAVDIKKGAFLFVMPPPAACGREMFVSSFNPILHATRRIPGQYNLLVDQLCAILKNVTVVLDDINAPIPYGALVESFRAIQDILS